MIKDKTKGVWYAIGAYVLWGLLPIYWKLLHQVPSLQLLCHRIVWSCVSLILIIILLRQWQSFYTAIKKPRVLVIYLLAAILVSVNWFVFIWAIQANFIIEASLGYFITPLISIALGVLFLHETLRPMQWIAAIIAGIGIIYLTYSYHMVPWISLALALSFGFYGLVKKIAPLGSFNGLTLETIILFPLATAYLFYIDKAGNGAWMHISYTVDLLLFGAGAVTIVPLLLFTSAARSINLSLVGFLQYIAPILHFLIGRFLYHETFTKTQLIGFSFVWVALAVLSLEGLLVLLYRNKQQS